MTTTGDEPAVATTVLAPDEHAALDGVALLSMLTRDVAALVRELFVPISLAFGDVLFEVGDPADGFYVVVEGNVRVIIPGTEGTEISAALLGPGQAFGERSMLEDATRTATARASTGTARLLFLHRAVFEALVRLHPQLRSAFEAQGRAQRQMDLLRTQHAFGRLDRAALAHLVADVESLDVPAGTTLFTEGDDADAAYLVESGRLAATTAAAAAPVGFFRAGDTFGEAAIIDGTARSATLSAVDDCRVMRIDRDRFLRLLDEQPAFREAMEERVSGFDGTAKSIPLDFVDEFVPVAAGQKQVVEGGREVVLEPSLVDAAELDTTTATTSVVKKGKFPHIQQIDEMDCGAACLGMLARAFGRAVSLPHIRAAAGTSTQGTSLAGIRRGGERIGIDITPVKASKSKLAELPMPFIAHWEGNHWVIVVEVTARHVRVADPALGMRRLTHDEFNAGWTGFGATAVPTPKLAEAPTSNIGLDWIWPFLAPHKVVIGVAILLALVAAGFQVAMPLLTQSVVDSALGPGDLGRLNTLTLMLVGLLIASVAVGFVQSQLLVRSAVKVDEETLDHLTGQLLSLPLSYFETRRTGDIERRISGMQQVREVVVDGGISFIIAVAQLSVALLLLFRASWVLGLGFLLSMPVYVVVARLSAKRIGPLYGAMEQAFGLYTSRQIDLLKGVETVKSMGAEERMRRKLGQGFVDLARRLTASYRSLAVFGAGVQAVQLMLFVTFVYLTGRLVLNGTFTLGQYVAYNALVAMATGPVMMLLGLWDSVQTSTVLLNRLQDAFEQEPEQSPDEPRRPVPSLEGRVTLRHMDFAYSDGPLILHDVSLEVPPGTRVAFVGRSGSGKSTLLRVLSGLQRPTRGQVLFDGVDVNELDLRELRRKLGFVLQKSYLFDATIAENIAFGAENVDMDDVQAAAEIANAHEFVSRLPMGYDTPIGESGLVLSGGQAQRIAIARSLYHQPPVLLFDEATSALDTESERAVKENLDRIMVGRTSFVVAHRLSTIRDADIIVVLDAGRIVEQGSHDELMARDGMYAYLHSQQLASH